MPHSNANCLALEASASISAPKLRRPTARDGATIWQMVRTGGALDLNSAYAYLMMAEWFQDTCVVAEDRGALVGFVMGFVPPRQPDTVLVWQIGVDAAQRGRGVGRQLLDALADNAPGDVRYLEATITTSNRMSEALFCGFARERRAPCVVSDLFPADLFPSGGHEAERLFRIGPLPRPNTTEELVHGNL